jgi:hypothetical protein
VGVVFRQVEPAIEQHLKVGRRVAEVHGHNTVVHLSAVPIPLATDSDRLFTTLGRPRLIHAPDGIGMSMVLDDDLLAAISEFFFIPLDRFEESLQRPRRRPESQRDGLRRLAVQIRQLPCDINSQQIPRVASAETVGEQREKRNQLLA